MTKVSTTLVFLLFLLSFSYLQTSVSVITPDTGYCDLKCGMRCSKAGMKDRCLKYCGICCNVCKCVPSGTFGNKHECPCYRDMLNSKGKPKCP